MEDLAGLVEATGSRFTQLELIGQGSFGDVYKALQCGQLLDYHNPFHLINIGLKLDMDSELFVTLSYFLIFRFDKELNKEVAIKVIDLEESEDDIDDIQKEISVLSQCRCPYITEYYGSFLNQTKLWIIMEYMAGGSVADLVGPPLDEMSIAYILRDLLHAVDYLHSEGKIHRDIKGISSNP
ncbi:MAP kinase [Trifolium pratense]|uniref:MAP kinase n=1 Tax=Trifolium pratense TaxID=57577 RepID=A0A2K3PES7_TRIPR|nr:MAP kinase [Trifolium pratense]